MKRRRGRFFNASRNNIDVPPNAFHSINKALRRLSGEIIAVPIIAIGPRVYGSSESFLCRLWRWQRNEIASILPRQFAQKLSYTYVLSCQQWPEGNIARQKKLSGVGHSRERMKVKRRSLSSWETAPLKRSCQSSCVKMYIGKRAGIRWKRSEEFIAFWREMCAMVLERLIDERREVN